MKHRADILAALALIGVLLTLRSVLAHSSDTNPVTTWPFDSDIYVVTAIFGWLYFRGLRNWKSRSRAVSRWQIASFYVGLAILFLTLESPLDEMADHAFWIHQIQHLLLRMVGPILIMLGAPVTPILRGLPMSVRQKVVRPIVRDRRVRAVYGFLTNHVVASVLFIGTLYFWQLPSMHDEAILNNTVHNYGMHLSMFLTGMIFWWIIIDPKPRRARLHYGARAILLGMVTFPNTLLGVIITFSRSNLYTAYDQLGRLWHLTPTVDQQIGGILLWIPGDMMSVATAAIVWSMWYRQDKEESESRAKAAIREEWAAWEAAGNRREPAQTQLDD